MTVKDMILLFERLLQTTYKRAETEEKLDSYTIVKFLNQAQDRIMHDKYMNAPTVQENIAIIERNNIDLNHLIITQSLTTAAATQLPYVGYAVTADLPNTAPNIFSYYIRSDSKLTRANLFVISSASWVPNVIGSHDNLTGVLTNAWNSPILRNPVVLIEDNDIVVIGDTYTTLSTGADTLSLTYLRRPKTLHETTNDNTYTTQCEIATHSHEELVNVAFRMYTEEYKFKLVEKKA